MTYRESYERRKELYLQPKYLRSIGTNAAWIFPLLFTDKYYDWWYVPGGARSQVYSYTYEKHDKINYRDESAQAFADSLVGAVKKDLSYWKYKVSDNNADGNYWEITVYIYESNSFFLSELGYRYRYFFIRQEPFLKFYSMLYDGKIYEGHKEELASILKTKRNIIASASIFWKEN